MYMHLSRYLSSGSLRSRIGKVALPPFRLADVFVGHVLYFMIHCMACTLGVIDQRSYSITISDLIGAEFPAVYKAQSSLC